MDKPSFEELILKLKKLEEENERLKKENSDLQSKIFEMQFVIKKYIIDN